MISTISDSPQSYPRASLLKRVIFYLKHALAQSFLNTGNRLISREDTTPVRLASAPSASRKGTPTDLARQQMRDNISEILD